MAIGHRRSVNDSMGSLFESGAVGALGEALKNFTKADLRRAAEEFFDPKKHAGVLIQIKK